MKVQISVNDNLLERMDDFAKKNYLTRSGLISMATAQYLNQTEVMLAIKNMSLSLRKIADNNVVDEDTLRQFEDFERMCKMLAGQ